MVRMMRWIAPVAVAGILVGGAVTVNAISASAGSAGLPSRTAAQLLVDVEQAKLTALSGTVVQSSDLGIPSVPGIGGTDSSSMTSLISGTHTLRVWYDGTDKSRIALLGSLGETDIIKDGANLWTWSSKDNTATHRTLGSTPTTDRSKNRAGAGLDPTDLPKTPQQAADAVLAAVDPSTVVGTEETGTVAGRSVYQLTLRPRTQTGSLIDSISIAIDGTTHIPLRVQVLAVGQSTPAFQVAFSSVDFTAPDAAQFTFNPPPGAQITQEKSNAHRASSTATSPTADRGMPSRATRPGLAGSATRVVGTGWSTVLIADSSSIPSAGRLGRVLAALPRVSGSWGSGRVLAGTAFSMVIGDKGNVAVGAVTPQKLYDALAK